MLAPRQGLGRRAGQVEGISRGHEDTFAVDGYVHCLDYGDGFLGAFKL